MNWEDLELDNVHYVLVLFNLYSNENGSHITKGDFQKFILSIECVESTTIDSDAISVLFDKVGIM